MQLNIKLTHIALCCLLLSGGVPLFVSVWAQAPQKAQIAFNSKRDGNMEIYIMDADGNNQHRLTNSPGQDSGLSWFDLAFTYKAVSSINRLMSTWGWIKQGSE
jgi:hypothetical protein